MNRASPLRFSRFLPDAGKGTIMVNPAVIENIEAMRRQEGIDDVQLREEVRGLKVGDLVKLTLLTDAKSSTSETLAVRITSVRGRIFHGELAGKPTSAGLSTLRVGPLPAF